MNLFNKLGNAMLHRLAPETSATAGWEGCLCGEYLARKESRCVGAKLYVRCCGPAPQNYCGDWSYCGPECA